MRIVIDVQSLQTLSSHRGIGRYTASLLKALIRNNTKHEIVLMLNASLSNTISPLREAFDDLLSQDKIRLCFLPKKISANFLQNTKRRKVAEKIRHAFIDSLCPDVFFLVSPFEGFFDEALTSFGSGQNNYKTVAMIYDLIPMVFPKQYLKKSSRYKEFYKEKIDQSIRADAWLTISESSKNDICNLLSLDDSLVTNISAACNSKFKPLTLNRKEEIVFKSEFGIRHPFILYTGGADFRKNLPAILKTFSKLSTDLKLKHQLVFAGITDVSIIEDLRALTEDLNLSSDEVLIYGHVSDDHLCKLYNLCKVYFFPSLYEGFGLPILEAMACGAPVIASRLSSLPELIVYDDAMFDPLNAVEMTSKLIRALTDNVFRKTLIQNGRAQIKRFSWDSVAIEALKVIEKLSPPSNQRIKNVFEFQSKNVCKLIDDISILSSKLNDEELKDVAASIALNHPVREKKKIFVDISELVNRDAATGVQRVTRNILHQLLLNPPEEFEVEAVYAPVAKTSDDLGYKKAFKFSSKTLNFKVLDSDDLIEPIPGDIFLGLDLQHHTTRTQSLYLKQLRDYGVLVYFVVYDLLPIQFPKYWPKKHSVDIVHSEWLQTIAMFDGLICISRSVADELVDWIRLNMSKTPRSLNVGWFHLGAEMDNNFVNIDKKEDIVPWFGENLTFLMVGTIEPRKSYDQVLKAFDLLWKEGIEANLVIVGKQGWLVRDLVKKMNSYAKKNINFFWFESASDKDLDKIYKEADCLIAASKGEGFGLPLIEASHYNLPIIARNIPVFKEVAGDNAFFFKGNKANDLFLALKKWINHYKLNQHPKANISYLTWRESTQQLTDVIIENNWYKRVNLNNQESKFK